MAETDPTDAVIVDGVDKLGGMCDSVLILCTTAMGEKTRLYRESRGNEFANEGAADA